MRRYKRIRKSPHQYDPVFGADREWKNEAIVSIICMTQYGDFNRNIYMDDILSLLSECDT